MKISFSTADLLYPFSTEKKVSASVEPGTRYCPILKSRGRSMAVEPRQVFGILGYQGCLASTALTGVKPCICVPWFLFCQTSRIDTSQHSCEDKFPILTYGKDLDGDSDWACRKTDRNQLRSW